MVKQAFAPSNRRVTVSSRQTTAGPKSVSLLGFLLIRSRNLSLSGIPRTHAPAANRPIGRRAGTWLYANAVASSWRPLAPGYRSGSFRAQWRSGRHRPPAPSARTRPQCCAGAMRPCSRSRSPRRYSSVNARLSSGRRCRANGQANPPGRNLPRPWPRAIRVEWSETRTGQAPVVGSGCCQVALTCGGVTRPMETRRRQEPPVRSSAVRR
jgi:hypothetical protein